MYQNVTYGLQGLEKLLATGLSGERATGDLFEGEQRPDHIKAVIARLKNQFVQRTFAFEDEGSLERYVRFHERVLIQVCDTCSQVGCESVCREIEQMLSFIESVFAQYFDYEAKPPLCYIATVEAEVKDWLRRRAQKLKAHAGDPQGLEMALLPLKHFVLRTTDKEITYRSLGYVREVGKELEKFLQVDGDGDTVNREIRRLLYYLNFNFRKCLDYVVADIRSVIDEAASLDVRIERLAFMQKQVEQLEVRRGIGFNVNAASLKNQVLNYLAAEMEYVRCLQKSDVKPRGAVSDDESPFRFKLNMSVAQTACLLKVMSDVGLIRNTNMTALIRFVSDHFETPRAERVSAGSFRIRFYNIESSTMVSVRNILSRLKDGIPIP